MPNKIAFKRANIVAYGKPIGLPPIKWLENNQTIGKRKVMTVLPISSYPNILHSKGRLESLNKFNTAVALGENSYLEFLKGQNHLEHTFAANEKIVSLNNHGLAIEKEVNSSERTARTTAEISRMHEIEEDITHYMGEWKRFEKIETQFKLSPDFLLLGLTLDPNMTLLGKTEKAMKQNNITVPGKTSTILLTDLRSLYGGKKLDWIQFYADFTRIRDEKMISAIVDKQKNGKESVFIFNRYLLSCSRTADFIKLNFPGSKMMIVADIEKVAPNQKENQKALVKSIHANYTKNLVLGNGETEDRIIRFAKEQNIAE